jgi:hypothetical protein
MLILSKIAMIASKSYWEPSFIDRKLANTTKANPMAMPSLIHQTRIQ